MGIVESIRKLRKTRLEDINSYKLHKRIGAWFFCGMGFFCMGMAIVFGVILLDTFALTVFLFIAVFMFLLYMDDIHLIHYHLFDTFVKARKEAGLLDERNRDVEPAKHVEKNAAGFI